MFDNTRSRFLNTNISTFGDVENALRGLYEMFNCCLVEHEGRTVLENTAMDNASPNGSTLVVKQYNDGVNSVIPDDVLNGTDDGPHAIYVPRGTTRFDKKVYFQGNPPVTFVYPPQVIFKGTASAKWAAGAPPTVAVTHATLGAVTVRLADTDTQDPNIRINDPVIFAACVDDGNYYAFDSQLDGKIGDVKWWLGTAGNISPGWRRLNSSGTYNANDAFLRCVDSGYSNMGATGGGTAHTHSVSGTTGAGGAHTHTVASHTHSISSDGGHTHTGYSGYATTDITIPSHSGNTDYAGTGITWPVTTGAGGTGATSSATSGLTVNSASTGISLTTTNYNVAGGAVPIGTAIVDPNHTHGITESGHTHAGPSHTHSIADPEPGAGATYGHRHSVGTLTHSVTEPNAGSGHRHSVSSDGSHTHTGATGGATPATDDPGTHTHSFSATTGSTSHLPTFLTLALIERFE